MHSTREDSRGFTITELLVSMTLFMVVSGSIWGALLVANRGKIATSETTQVSKNVRMALNLAGRDTYNAGYGYPLRNTVVLPDNRISTRLGIPNDVDTSRDTVPPIIAGNEINANTYSTTPGTMTDQVTFLFKDSTFNLIPANDPNGVATPLDINAATTTSGIDEIVPISGSNAACRVNDIFLVTGNTGSALAVATALNGTSAIQFSNSDILQFNQTGTSGPLRGITIPASIMRVRMVTYFVTADGVLMRREFGNAPTAALTTGGWIDEPLVYGVEDFNIQYVMDNGALSDNPSAGPDGTAGNADDTQANLAAIRQVRFTISIRSVELSAGGQPYRTTMTSTYSTRNLGYDAN